MGKDDAVAGRECHLCPLTALARLSTGGQGQDREALPLDAGSHHPNLRTGEPGKAS